MRFFIKSASPHIPGNAELQLGRKREVLTIAKVIGYEGSIEFDPTKPDGTPGKLMDSIRLNNLGWQASISLEEGLRLAYSDFLKNHTCRM